MRTTDRWYFSWLCNAVSLNSYLTSIVTRRPTTWRYSSGLWKIKHPEKSDSFALSENWNLWAFGLHGHGYACRLGFGLTSCHWSWRLSCRWTTTKLSLKMEILPMKESEELYFRGWSTHILPETPGPNPCLSLTRKNWQSTCNSTTGVY